MLFWYILIIFVIIDFAVLLYYFKYMIPLPKGLACKKNICGYWELPKCSNPKVSLEDFKSRNGREQTYPCSSTYMGFNSAGEHVRYIRSSKFSNSILIWGLIISLIALETGILLQTRERSSIVERIEILEFRIEELEKGKVP